VNDVKTDQGTGETGCGNVETDLARVMTGVVSWARQGTGRPSSADSSNEPIAQLDLFKAGQRAAD
jgi:hypothetical protein